MQLETKEVTNSELSVMLSESTSSMRVAIADANHYDMYQPFSFSIFSKTLLVVLAQAVENIEEICAVPGLDSIVFGQMDLSGTTHCHCQIIMHQRQIELDLSQSVQVELNCLMSYYCIPWAGSLGYPHCATWAEIEEAPVL
jgi:hypothetical protein